MNFSNKGSFEKRIYNKVLISSATEVVENAVYFLSWRRIIVIWNRRQIIVKFRISSKKFEILLK